MVLELLDILMQNNKLQPMLCTTYKRSLEMDEDVNVKSKL